MDKGSLPAGRHLGRRQGARWVWRNISPEAMSPTTPRSRWNIAATISRFPGSPKAWATVTKAAAYLHRAQDWKNLFDPASGYIRPRTADGAWVEPFSPRGGKGFVEGSAAQYLWLVNFNLRGLIEKARRQRQGRRAAGPLLYPDQRRHEFRVRLHGKRAGRRSALGL